MKQLFNIVQKHLLVLVTDRYGTTQNSYLFTDMTVMEAEHAAELLYMRQEGNDGSADSVYVSDSPIEGANSSAGAEIKS